MEQILAKAQILIQQQRYKEAEELLSELLRTEPNQAYIYYLLTDVKMQQDKWEDARTLIDTALGIDPESSALYFAKARIEMHDKNYDKAESLLYDALQIEPEDDNCYGLWAFIKLERKQYDEALGLANTALELNSENLLALNTRSTALIKLDRKEDAFATIEGALNDDPNNAYTHANYGWGLLEKGEHKKALEHFREALTHDPASLHAKTGMAEAIKASNPVYRLYLKYAFWIGNLTSQYQWAFIIGFYFGTRFLRSIANASPALKPFLMPLVILLTIVAFSTWIIRPIGNLFLRFNKYGQYLLSKREKISSNFVGASLLASLIGVVLYFVINDDKYLMIGAFGLIMTIPFSSIFAVTRPKYVLPIYTAAMLIAGTAGIALAFTSGEIFNLFSTSVLIGFVVYQWVVNFLIIRDDNV